MLPAVIKVDVKELKAPAGKEIILDLYEVKKGDWLITIAEDLYGDKDLWDVIRRYNKYVKNPHWIFPGDKLIVPKIVAKLPAIPEKEAEEPVQETVNEPKKIYGDFIGPPDFEFDGTIMDFKEQKSMYSQGDWAFIDLGSANDVSVNQRFFIYRPAQYVVHPYTGEIMGNSFEMIGELVVMKDIQENSATSRIVYSNRLVEIGDMILMKR